MPFSKKKAIYEESLCKEAGEFWWTSLKWRRPFKSRVLFFAEYWKIATATETTSNSVVTTLSSTETTSNSVVTTLSSTYSTNLEWNKIRELLKAFENKKQGCKPLSALVYMFSYI